MRGLAADGVNSCHFHRRSVRQVRQQAGKPFCEHGLARAGRSCHEQMVGTGRSDFEGEPRLVLPGNIRQVEPGPDCRGILGISRRGPGVFHGEDQAVRAGAECLGNLSQGRESAYLCPRYKAGLGGIVCRNGDVRVACFNCRHDGRQHSTQRPQPSVESKLRQENGPAGPPDVSGGSERGHDDGKVEPGTPFVHVRGHQVHRDLPAAQGQSGILCSRFHPVPGFIQRRVGEPQQNERGQRLPDIRLNLDNPPFQPDEPNSVRSSQAHQPIPFRCSMTGG